MKIARTSLLLVLTLFATATQAASTNVKAASRFAACEQTARNYLDAMHGMRVPQVEIVPVTALHDDNVGEFMSGEIRVLDSVTDCGVILHELVHWWQWKHSGQRDCTETSCWEAREAQAYAIENRWKQSQKD